MRRCSLYSIDVVLFFEYFIFIFFFFFFFFSSRRRHTRWPRDWSSDVCSSDLAPEDDLMDETMHRRRLPGEGDLDLVGLVGRSEERRVGKECRSRWSPYH